MAAEDEGSVSQGGRALSPVHAWDMRGAVRGAAARMWEWSLQILIPCIILNLRVRGGSCLGSEISVHTPDYSLSVYYVSDTVLDIFI